MADGSITRGGLVMVLDANPMVGEAKTGSKRAWTTRELKVLRETYPTGGVPACLPLLPGRSARSIYAMAGKVGLKSPRQPEGKRESWTTNAHIDDTIRRVYQNAPTKGDVLRLSQTLMRPRWWVSRRAADLGLVLPRFKPLPWSPEELAIVRERATIKPNSIRQALKRAGYVRTETAIVVQIKRMGLSRVNEDPDVYTARSLAELMGIDSHLVVSWINKGWLRAKKDGEGHYAWKIHRKDVRSFVVNNVAAVDVRRVDKFWFVDMLSNSTATNHDRVAA